jgi:hypothetical protein
MNTPASTPDAGVVDVPPRAPYTVSFERLLDIVPAKDWAKTWPAHKTVLVRMTSKALRAVVDRMQLPVILRSNWHKLSDHPQQMGRSENTQLILMQIPIFTGSFLVKRLDLVDCGINGRAVGTLSTLLKQCPELAYLDLSHNDMGPEGKERLADGLRSCTSLYALLLTSNSIGRVGTLHLATVIPELVELGALDLGHNNISGADMDMFAPMLFFSSKIRYLKLDNNLIGDNLEELSHALAFTNCRYLDISYNNVGMSGLIHLVPFMMHLKLVTAGNPEIENVVLIGTRDVIEVD